MHDDNARWEVPCQNFGYVVIDGEPTTRFDNQPTKEVYLQCFYRVGGGGDSMGVI